MDEIDIPVKAIERNNFNPNVMGEEEYKALKADVIEGNYKAINVSPKNVFYGDEDLPRSRYVIVDGEHRWKAAVEGKLETIRAEVEQISESEAKSLSYRRNRERGKINPLKEATLFKSEVDQGLTQQKIAEKYNVSQPYVANRLGLIKLDETVVEMYREPSSAFKKSQLERYEKKRAEWEQRREEAGEKGSSYMFWQNKPEKPEEEDLIPRGMITPSHLEAISSLPGDKQAAIAADILGADLSVRKTENRVKQEKEDLAKQQRLREALKKAKRRKCPACGSEPRGFAWDDEQRFRCSRCSQSWEYMKTRKQVEAEREAAKTESDKRKAEELKEKFREAKENPSYVRMHETPEQLDEKVKPWLLRKIRQFTEVKRIRIEGKRGDKGLLIEYTPPAAGFANMNLDYAMKTKDQQIGFDLRFRFKVQPKQYKKYDAKCRVDMAKPMKASEENREALRRFFREIVETHKDPWEE